ncbi:cell envelope integrity protein TolA [Colwellia sp. MB02u-18]|uniref:cell envelope integrity protein TolA n=1 Tax=unclassified Colwellia TaxID=196834 RepID=UPI0015F65F13|nr:MULTISPECIES: cell envelope integrity protein TolA [unclassified Colwellia]MBA6223492.1 cell envelope integrity protein TolA [Colwellia sp. MB3u-45]MBA6269151.1 cell envelope integrity protein TolA [Colwellia sp. MB3u-43]MBA6320763.1 cell envelope integrity protein TolA [Colwellia sp. MB02u-19]MBA6323975.1 cell envelope integrity protein TolA [Colwellia sp. MB02u-18]MBA6330911.1 cell envelope integrity protein TolA [Colwellia sp. MB02u-12]
MSSKYSTPLALSFAIHIVLAVVLLWGDFSSPPKSTPTSVQMEPIQAVVVERSKVEAQINKIKKQKADDAQKLKNLENSIAAAKEKQLNEEKRIKSLERQRKIKEQEKKAADSAAKKSQAKANAADKQRKQKELERAQADKAAADAQAKRIKEEQAAKKAEDLRKKKAADQKRKQQEDRERAAQQKLLEQQMAEEMANRQQARRQQMMTEIGRFTALITQTIKRNLITDRSTMEGKSCKLTISLAPSGFVTNVVTGQGDRRVCEAAKTAVYKAGTLPVSKDPEIFREMRTISLTVAPDKFN